MDWESEEEGHVRTTRPCIKVSCHQMIFSGLSHDPELLHNTVRREREKFLGQRMQPRCQLNIEPTYILIHILVAPSTSHNLHVFWSLCTFIFIAAKRQFPFIYSIQYQLKSIDFDLCLLTCLYLSLRVRIIFVTNYKCIFEGLKRKMFARSLKEVQTINEISMMTL